MHILYCSALCSKEAIKLVYNDFGKILDGHTIQKYHRLFVDGFVKNNCITDTISSIPIKRSKRLIYRISRHKENGVIYNFLPVISIPIIKHLIQIFGTTLLAINWYRKVKKKECFVVCDALNISMCIGLLPLKIFGIHVIGLMTDMPGLMVHSSNNLLVRIISHINRVLLKSFDSYIFLTEEMNVSINNNKKPYMILEGLVDANMEDRVRIRDKNTIKVIYAGGLFEKYGVNTLIDAFSLVPGDNLQLRLYGNGPLVEHMSSYENKDPRIKYLGIKPNNQIVEEELTATLLVNPRPTNEEFTKYSFPSKNMEYMVSGTPVLTTKLPGMPKEYYPYVFIEDTDTIDGMKKALSHILLEMNEDELSKKGAEAKNFVLTFKNNIYQTKRIIDFYTNECK